MNAGVEEDIGSGGGNLDSSVGPRSFPAQIWRQIRDVHECIHGRRMHVESVTICEWGNGRDLQAQGGGEASEGQREVG